MKRNTLAFELSPQVFKVEDLTVKDDAESFFIVPHGLIASLTGIDDGKPSKSQANKLVMVNVLMIGPALFQSHGGGRHVDHVDLANEVKCEYACNAAHSRLNKKGQNRILP